MLDNAAQAIYDRPAFDGDPIGVHLAHSMHIDAASSSVEELRDNVMDVCRQAAIAAAVSISEDLKRMNIDPLPTQRMVLQTKPRSSDLRFISYVYAGMTAWAWYLGTVPDAYVAMLLVIAFAHAIAGEVLKELGR
ncbi:hypothetical protein [Neorhizobium sp. NCHU2750]|uniref:hypothetical protein n=1 Tax=Neorhizobium sp. NCHU2750 TaxID=1825976 RepID=UPI0013C3E59C